MSAGKKHSVVAPSAASRWMACPPSALLTEKIGGDQQSVYAAEGVLAHRIAELYLTDWILGKKWLQQFPGDYDPVKENPTAVAEMAKCKTDPLYYDGMCDEVRVYTDYVRGLWDAAGPGSTLEVERPVPLFYKKDDDGTIDAVIYGGGDKTLYVTDLKFGKGIRVEAERNKQLLIYAQSAYEAISAQQDAPAIERVTMTIVQPRLDSITTWTLDVAELEMESLEVWSKAESALGGGGKFAPGDHCRFCPAKPRCKALAGMSAEFATDVTDPALLSNDEIAVMLGKIDVIRDWVDSVKSYAMKQALAGSRFDGWKLVPGVSRRKIRDEKGLTASLAVAGYDVEFLRRWSFITLGELEKLVAKDEFETLCLPFIEKPEAPPVLVEVSDPRQEYGVARAIDDFKEFN